MSNKPTLEELLTFEQNNINTKEQKSQNKFYNYIYLDPRKPGKYTYEGLNFSLLYEPFYAGKGCGKRKYIHLKSFHKENNLKANKIKTLIKIFDLKILESYILQYNQNLFEKDSLSEEINLIKIIGRKELNKGPLCNHTDGGEGVTNLSPTILEKLKNRIFSEETILKFKKRSSGNNNPQSKHYLKNVKGLTEEEVDIYLKQKAAKSAEKQKGKKLSSERKKQMSLMLKGKSYEERFGLEKANELKLKRSESQKGKTFEEKYGLEKANEMKQNLSKVAKNRIKTKEEIEKTNLTKLRNGSGKGANNPSAKPYQLINHNTNEILDLKGCFEKFMFENKFPKSLFLKYLNKGPITEENILSVCTDKRKRINKIRYKSLLKYIGYELIL